MSWQDIKFFSHDNFRLAYREEGEGDPVLLIHGFASSSKVNWVSPGWFSYLVEAGYHVIAIDNRGHGESQITYDSKAYTPEAMADDAAALLKHLNLSKAHIMGYSMGARISAFLALRHPSSVQSLVFGGLGIGMVTGAGHWEPVQQALLAKDVNEIIDNPRGLMFRNFADRTKSDRLALAACVITSKKELSEQEVRAIKAPCLVVVGENDDISGASQPLADLIENAEAITLPKRDHMLAVGDRLYKKAALEFFRKHSF